jgi:hypothetical protein
MLFDEKTPGLRYLKSVYLEHAPNRLFTWKQAWGNALFWTTQNNATHSYLWFWDLSNHLGDVEPTRLDVGVGQCMGSIYSLIPPEVVFGMITLHEFGWLVK